MFPNPSLNSTWAFKPNPTRLGITRYTIETLLLEPNILRDSILVRMELLPFEVHPFPFPCTRVCFHYVSLLCSCIMSFRRQNVLI